MPTSAPASARPALDLASLLDPRAIAVIGASADDGRHNGRPIANLQRTGYAGRVYPVTAREGDVRGLASYRRIGDVPGPVDLAYVLVRADRVPGIVEECAVAGVQNIVVCSSGFAEEGAEGHAEQRRIRQLAWQHGARVIGPNCIGVVSVTDNAVSCTTLNITVEHTPGDVAIVSQSGGMATNLFNRAQGDGVGVRAMLSLGNEADVDVADAVAELADDEATRTILLYLEELRDFPRFRDAVARARAAGKHVVALKVGRTDAGVRSAQSHTGAMAGSYAVFRDIVSALGVTVVESLDALVDAAKLLQQLPAPRGRRALIVSPSGGECGYVADLAEETGLELPELSNALAAQLQEVMRFGSPGNPLDLTGQVIGDNELLGRVFTVIAESAEFDMVLVALPTWGPFDSERLMPAIIDAASSSVLPMVVTAWQSAGLTEHRDSLLSRAPIVAFGDAARAVRALNSVVRTGPDRYASLARDRARVEAAHVSASSSRGGSGTGPAVHDSDEYLDGVPVVLDPAATEDESAAKRWLARYGVTVSDERVLLPREVLPGDIEFPVVVKGICRGVAHKSEYGLVRADVSNPAELRTAADEIDAAARDHGLNLDGVLVARCYEGTELIAGAVDDPAFGKILMLGAGGMLAELLDDKAFVVCPASAADIAAALTRLRVHRLLTGFRGRSSDVDALIALLVRVSHLVAGCDGLAELDLNPIIVGAPGEGAVVVDALVEPH